MEGTCSQHNTRLEVVLRVLGGGSIPAKSAQIEARSQITFQKPHTTGLVTVPV